MLLLKWELWCSRLRHKRECKSFDMEDGFGNIPIYKVFCHFLEMDQIDYKEKVHLLWMDGAFWNKMSSDRFLSDTEATLYTRSSWWMNLELRAWAIWQVSQDDRNFTGCSYFLGALAHPTATGWLSVQHECAPGVWWPHSLFGAVFSEDR